MKKFISRLVNLKPFDETEDSKIANEKYINSNVLTLGILSSSFFSFAGFVLAVMHNKNALLLLSIAVGLSAITSGLEWSAGLKARASNQLFVCVLSVLLITLLNTI